MADIRDEIVWDGGGYRVTISGGYPPVAWKAERDRFGNLHYTQVVAYVSIASVFGQCIRELTKHRLKPNNHDEGNRPGASAERSEASAQNTPEDKQ